MPVLPKPSPPAYYDDILRAERALGSAARLDRPPAEHHLDAHRALGQVAYEIWNERGDGSSRFVTSTVVLAAVFLSNLRCLRRDIWQFPDAPGRPPITEPSPVCEDTIDHVRPIEPADRPVPVSDIFADTSLAWADYMDRAESIRHFCNGTAEEGDLWMADPLLHRWDMAELWGAARDATSTAFDLVARAKAGFILLKA